jgi:hypothetical protein
MIRIELTSPEIMLAAQAGVMRQVENLKRGEGLNTQGYDERNPWQIHIEGCCGEMAVAKYLGLYWKGKGKRGEPDVADMEVRTRPFHDADLILYKKDSPSRIFWHVTGVNGIYMIHGWIIAHEGQEEAFWSDKYNNGRPAYFVPNIDLRDPQSYNDQR